MFSESSPNPGNLVASLTGVAARWCSVAWRTVRVAQSSASARGRLNPSTAQHNRFCDVTSSWLSQGPRQNHFLCRAFRGDIAGRPPSQGRKAGRRESAPADMRSCPYFAPTSNKCRIVSMLTPQGICRRRAAVAATLPHSPVANSSVGVAPRNRRRKLLGPLEHGPAVEEDVSQPNRTYGSARCAGPGEHRGGPATEGRVACGGAASKSASESGFGWPGAGESWPGPDRQPLSPRPSSFTPNPTSARPTNEKVQHEPQLIQHLS